MKPEKIPSFDVHYEAPQHQAAIKELHERVFGPGRFARAAFRVREEADPDLRFCFVAEREGTLLASVRLTRIKVGEDAEAFLLGPLCVLPDLQGRGLGRGLVRQASATVDAVEPLPILLVGDHSYYGTLGFERVTTKITLPGPVDPHRLLMRWPENASFDPLCYAGAVKGVTSNGLL